MTSIQEKLDAARKDLLDLSLRNTLLNYRKLRSKGLEIVDELPEQVFQMLVSERHRMSFVPAPESEMEGEKLPGVVFEQPSLEQLDNGEESGIPARHLDYRLQTDYSSSQLQRRLLNTYYAARTSIEEHGVNTLYLALGLLHWYEAEDSEIARLAPLILVPVQLARSDVRHRFRIEYSGDEIGSNLSLEQKLKFEHRLGLPSLEDEEELDVQRYFRLVARAVSNLPRWWVEYHAINLGFFSFTKFLMYKDLDADQWPPERRPTDHSIVRALLGDGFSDSDPSAVETKGLDRSVDPLTMRQIWDADSSQTLAILETLSGRNLVIQGPPGTGKSQTITNVIAEYVGDNKKVLFVAEKMAALQVVKRRLDNAKLGDVCLELHSHKTNKKQVLAELKRTLELGQPISQLNGREFDALRETRDHLNQYAEDMNSLIGASGVTPFRAVGELLRIGRRTEAVSLPSLDNSTLRGWQGTKFRGVLALTEQLQAVLRQIGVPHRHCFWGSVRKVFLPTEVSLIKRSSKTAIRALEEARHSAAKLGNEIGTRQPVSGLEADTLAQAGRWAIRAPSLSGFSVKDTSWLEKAEPLIEAVEAGRTQQTMLARRSRVLMPESWDEDVLSLRGVYSALGAKWWRLLSRQYRAAHRHFRELFRNKPPRDPAERLQILDDILAYQRLGRSLGNKEALLASLLGPHWKGFRSDWDLIGEVAQYLKDAQRAITEEVLPVELLTYLAGGKNDEALRTLVSGLENALTRLHDTVANALELVELDPSIRWPGLGVRSLSWDELGEMFRSWERSPELLQQIVRFNHLREALEERELRELVEIASSWGDGGSHLADLLRYSWYSGLLEDAMTERPSLATFDGATHEQILKDFRKLDSQLLDLNRARVAAAHWEGLPRQGDMGQLGILKREFQKKRRHLAIRKLLSKAGNAVQAIKPVFMMSPLSVAAYLAPEGVHFDLVIFDEASQVTPIDAFGAILRGQQAVVVGDSKQLPPTPFFEKLGTSDEDDEDQLTADLESILGMFCAQGAPERMLRWHYRSRHESLIAVSNHEFYDDKLVVFPSPARESELLGLKFSHLPTTAYERGRGRGINRDEAKAVAGAVMEHVRKTPHLTLAVAAFSQAQMQVILDELELLRREDPSWEGFFSAHPEEPFFVKNLENVQGDERDVILISVGYGRTAQGYLSMNFGPLNQEGGERRLNVLITRARQRCLVFSNLTSDDLDLRRSQARGVAALKTYLRYAETGVLDVPLQTGDEPQSPFEAEVANSLRSYGFEVDHQVGSSGFFIDLAVRDPTAPGRYLVGIECDGATYHGAAWARDRDRLRQTVLEDLGWTIHRIWSTDWFRYPDQELRRLLETIEGVRVREGRELGSPPRDRDLDPTGGKRASAPFERQTQGTLDQELEATPYQLAKIWVQLRGRQLHEVPAGEIAQWLVEVVDIEGPVHIKEAAARIVNAAGLSRVGRRILAAVRAGARRGIREGKFRIWDDDFLVPADMACPLVRDRSTLPTASRKIELIARREIEEALKLVIRSSHGISADDAAQAACKLFGFKRVSNAMTVRLRSVLNRMAVAGQTVDQEGCLFLRRD